MSSKVTLLLFRIVAQAHSVFSSAVHMDDHPGHSASVTLVLQFLTRQSIQIHFILVKHCSHTMLKLFDGFWPLVYLQLTKIASMYAAHNGAQRGHINSTTVKKKKYSSKVETATQ